MFYHAWPASFAASEPTIGLLLFIFSFAPYSIEKKMKFDLGFLIVDLAI
jgi:hypothetical protein